MQGGTGLYDYGARQHDPLVGRWDIPDHVAELAPNLSPYRYCYNNPVNYTDPFGLYEYDLNGNIVITNPFEISTFINSFGKGGIPQSMTNMTNFITQNFALDLDEVKVIGNNPWSYRRAGQKISEQQRKALEKAKLDGSIFYGVDVFTSDYFAGGAAATLPGIGIFVNKEHLTDLDLLMHEYGHILQARKYGLGSFYQKIAPVSLMSGYYSQKYTDYAHHGTWTEWSASDLAKDYFHPTKWNTERFPLLPQKVRPGTFPSVKPNDFYLGKL